MAREREAEQDEDTAAELERGLNSFVDEKLGGDGGGGGKGGKGARAAAADRDDDAGDDGDDGEDGEGGDEADDVDEEDDSEDADEDADDESDDDEDDEDDEEGDEGDESDDDESDDADDDEGLDPEVEAAAARHQLPTNFEDIVRQLPKNARAAARQAFQQRLKEVESGLGRAFQEARTERSELVRIKAERKAQEENPVDYIADLLETDSKLLDRLNEEMENRENPRYRAARQKERANEKKELERSAETEVQKTEQRRQRGTQVAALAQRLARDAGVPFKVVDKALYIAIMHSADKDLPDEAIRRIVKQEARDWRKLTGERTQEKRQEYIRSKSKQIRDGKRRVTARDRGHAPAPGRQREPKNLEDALTRAAKRILPDAPA